MSQWCAVEFVSIQLPLRHELTYQRVKPFIVMPLKQMSHFMHKNKRQAGHGFLSQFQIQPYSLGVSIAGTPKSFHFSDSSLIDLHPYLWLPGCQQIWQLFAKLAAIPSIQHCFPRRPIGIRRNAQRHGSVVEQANPGPAFLHDHVQPITMTGKVMALAAHEFTPGLAFLTFELSLLAANPSQSGYDGQPHCFIVKMQRGSDPHAAKRRIDAQVKVLDGFANHLHRNPADPELIPFRVSSHFAPLRSRKSCSQVLRRRQART